MYASGHEYDQKLVHTKAVEFPELDLKWPEIKNIKNMEDAKVLFRLANTKFKKALNYYVVDGFVTENVTIKQAISVLYKCLIKIE